MVWAYGIWACGITDPGSMKFFSTLKAERCLAQLMEQPDPGTPDARKALDALRSIGPNAIPKILDALAAGGPDTPALQLRLVQIEILAGRTAEGLERIQKIRAEGNGGPEAEHLAVLILSDAGRAEEARKVLDAARAVYSDSGALAGLDAALYLEADQAERADAILAAFLKDHPGDLDVVQMRTGIGHNAVATGCQSSHQTIIRHQSDDVVVTRPGRMRRL